MKREPSSKTGTEEEGGRVLVTGAAGSIGRPLVKRLRAGGYPTVSTDVVEFGDGTDTGLLDVTNAVAVQHYVSQVRPAIIFHLAGAKHAPEGELDPGHVARVNLDGTRNVAASATEHGARVIFSSTCKACNPETAYGASKLIAERLVLNAGGTVLRFYNVPESSGNVFRYWETIPAPEPIPWTDCYRYFINMGQAIGLTMAALELPPGRYAVNPGAAQWMRTVAAERYPDRDLEQIPRRRGDRKRELLQATSETLEEITPGIFRIRCSHDAV